MEKIKINKYFIIIAVLLIFTSIASNSLCICCFIQEKSIKSIPGVTFIEKSNGLNNPEKEGGNTELELADINNDGHLDIICVGDHGSPYINSNQHGIMVWFGDGEETWSVNQVGNFGYGGIEAGDINLDGYLDVVWGIHHDYGEPGFGDTLIGAALGDGTGMNWIPWATGLGTGGEDWGMFETDLADFDCNGLLDIISQSFGCCNGYHQYENNGDGTWNHVWSLSGGNTYANLETGDFNSDGFPDFVGNRDETYVFFGNGTFNFTLNQTGLPIGNWYGLDSGDINNDGFDDIIAGVGSSGVHCYVYDKQNDEWISLSDGLPTTGSYYPQFGDINGDGFLDIIAYKSPTGYVYLGDGNGNWISDATFSMPPSGGHSAFVVDGDFDHDGREDVVIQAEQGSWPSYQNVLKAFSPWLEPTELSVLVQNPSGGETFRAGSIRNIRWLSAVPQSLGDSTIEIQLSLNGENGPWNTIVSDIPNNGCYQWLINCGGSENCRIKIIATADSSTATDISESDFTIIGGNSPPSVPEIDGIVNGSAGKEYDYTFISIDPNDDDIWYYIDWNDGTYEDWIGCYESGEQVVVSHTWDEEGTYIIRAKAKDIFNVETDWGTLEVTMPVNQPIQQTLFQKLLN